MPSTRKRQQAPADVASLSPLLGSESPPGWFHSGQLLAWQSQARFVLMLCGTQSGKTVFGPWWLLREIRRHGAGEYAVVSPTFRLLSFKLLPEYQRVLKGLGELVRSPVIRFTFSPPGRTLLGLEDETTIYFLNASDSDQLESATLLACHSDECGQGAFSETSFEAIERRLAVHQGRHLMTTTPYEWNALKFKYYDAWLAGSTDIDVVQFRSTMNPSFPTEEYERAKGSMPAWRHRMMYDGEFTRPAGAVYDCFDDERHLCDRFLVPEWWERISGHDFGTVNAAGVFAAICPATGLAYVYRSWMGGGDAAGIVPELRRGEPWYAEPRPVACTRRPIHWGGAPSEDEWRAAYAEHGWPVNRPPLEDVATGINAVYEALQTGRLILFRDLAKLIQELRTYSYKLNDHGDPTREIDRKSRFHRIDALRYLVLGLPPAPLPGTRPKDQNPFAPELENA